MVLYTFNGVWNNSLTYNTLFLAVFHKLSLIQIWMTLNLINCRLYSSFFYNVINLLTVKV